MRKIFQIENKWVRAGLMLLLILPMLIRHLWHKGKVGRGIAICIILFITFKLYACIGAKDVSKEYQIVDLSAAYDSGRKRPRTDYIVIHHTAMNSRLKANILSIASIHMKNNGWSSIAYQYLIMDGKIYKLHSDDDIAPHTANYNSNSIGVCIHGNFSEEELSEADKDKLVWLIRKLQDEYHLDKSKVVKHGDLNATECCGTNINIEDIRECLKSY